MTTGDSKLEALRAEMHAELARKPKARPWWVSAVVLLRLNAAVLVFAAVTLRTRPAQPEGETLRLVTEAVLLLTIFGGTVLGLKPGSHAPRFAMAGFAGIGVLLSVLSGGEGAVSPFWSGTSCATTECLVALIPMALSVVLLSPFEFDLWRTLVGGWSGPLGAQSAL